MLVLSRAVGQSISIGDDIEITVLRLGSGTVRIGITAPKGTQVLRDDARWTVPHPGFSDGDETDDLTLQS